MKSLRANIYILAIFLVPFVFFAPFFIQGKLPIPTDALVGLYHPWRDVLRGQYPNGYPYKNPLITDPVRQQYPYRKLAIDELKKGTLPKWNPYSFSGTPLLANIQTAAFYPLNLLFWLFTDATAWSLLIFLQPLLAGLFTYAYLRNLNLSGRASFLGGLTYAFSGFMVAWLVWNTIGQVALWLPLILLAKDKLIEKFSWRWVGILVLAETSMILAGHLQSTLYVLGFSTVYLIVRCWHHSLSHFERSEKSKPKAVNHALLDLSRPLEMTIRSLIPFVFIGVAVFLLTSFQWIPTFRFITSSAREFDLSSWQRPDWFIPWKHLAQFIAPDFFGNPVTGNYSGVWNYGEFVGYVALFPLLMAVFALIARRDKKTLYFAAMLGVSVILAVPNWLSQLPYQLRIPFWSTLQPSRILVVIDFCLSILAALGLDYVVRPERERERRIHRVLAFAFLIITVMWAIVLFGHNLGITREIFNAQVAGRNLALPTGLFLISGLGMLGLSRFSLKKIILTRIFIIILLTMTLYDFYRFFHKFTPFTDAALLFPETWTVKFLQQNLGPYRYMTTDRRLIPPNVSIYYKLQSVDGYDPVYLRQYGEMVAAWTRGTYDISPAAFNRILTPEKYDSFIADLLGIKYVLSLRDEVNPKLKLVFREGETRVYENVAVLPRAFLVEEVQSLPTREDVMAALFANSTKLRQIAFTERNLYVKPQALTVVETAEVQSYEPQRVAIRVTTESERLLVLTDIYHPDWRVYINGRESVIFPVDFALRGVVVPRGESLVEFRI